MILASIQDLISYASYSIFFLAAVSLKKGFIPSNYVVKKVPDPFCTVCGVQHAGTSDHSFSYVDEYEDLLDQGFFIIIIPS
jgi:hypothetical protein